MNNEFHKFHEYSRSKEGLYFKEESYAIIGACFEVYNELGAGFLCFDCIVVELKAQNNLIDGNRAQVINYLRCSEKKLGLLVNFGNSSCLERERLVN